LTKGAMYFHFRSKHALALAVVDDEVARANDTVADLLARKFSGLETLIDFSYQLAVRDISEEISRAALNLVESIGRIEGLQAKTLTAWIENYARTVRRGVGEGDVVEDSDPHDVGRLLVSLYMGLRQTSHLDDPEQFLRDLEKTWALTLPGFVRAERIDYFRQFMRRRAAIAIGTTSALTSSS
jgi:TetR/AcrR family transcriptional regulator, transcriptional repressor for nem operon